jgi:Leucine-rich repeat (LRR) protein
MTVSKYKNLKFMINIFCCLWGCGILGLHIYASQIKEVNCLLGTRPWFKTKQSCSVMVVDCHQFQIQGDAKEITPILNTMDRRSVRSLIFSHCSSLHLPPIIQEFSDIWGFEIYNSTLIEWNQDAAIKNNLHSSLAYVYFTRVNMTTAPPAIVHESLPAFLTEFSFVQVHFEKEFQLDLSKEWTFIEAITLESCHLKQIPIFVMTLPSLQSISVVGNQIQTLPSQWTNYGTLVIARFSANPLVSLFPLKVDENLLILRLTFEATNVTELPLGMEEWYENLSEEERPYIGGFGSPYCQTCNDTLVTLCSDACFDQSTTKGIFPLAIVDAQRQLDQLPSA